MKKLGGCFVGGGDEDVRLLHMNALLYETVYRLHREITGGTRLAKGDPHNRIIAEAYGYIDENFTSSCTLSEIAGCVHVSPNYLHTLFKSVTGQTPFEYVTERRINKAKRLIMAGELTLLEVALACGFCSQSHFNKVFRECTGQTPAAYRRTLAEKYL
jgi:AraC-like DNA-binding protein